MKLILFFLLVLSLSFSSIEVFGEPIKITKSLFSDDIIYDGKWTYEYEWKPTSWNLVSDEQSTIHIRTAHYEQFIYVLLDYDVSDNTKHQNDYALFCIDGDNNKTQGINGDEFCFELSMNTDKPSTYLLEINDDGNLTKKQIDNHPDLIVVSNLSDENDRYSKIPHPTYEFRIPIDVFGRSNNYGVFISVYDSVKNKTLTWPSDVENVQGIPSPKIWGDMISPDNSLPEFPFPILVVVILSSFTIILGRFTNFSTRL